MRTKWVHVDRGRAHSRLVASTITKSNSYRGELVELEHVAVC